MLGYFCHPTSSEDGQKLPPMISQTSGVENGSNPAPYARRPRIPRYQYVSVRYPQRPRMSKLEHAQEKRRRSKSPSPDPARVQVHYRSRTPLIQQPDAASTTTVSYPRRPNRERIVIDLTSSEPEPQATAENQVYDQVTSVRIGDQRPVVIHQTRVSQPSSQGNHHIGLEVTVPAPLAKKRVKYQASDLQRAGVVHFPPERLRQSEVENHGLNQAIPQSLPQVNPQIGLQPILELAPQPVTQTIPQFIPQLTPQPAGQVIIQKIHPLPPKPDASTAPLLSSNPLIPTPIALPPKPPVSAEASPATTLARIPPISPAFVLQGPPESSAAVQIAEDSQRIRSQNSETRIFIDLTENDSDDEVDEVIELSSDESTTGNVRDLRYSAANQFTGQAVIRTRERAMRFALYMQNLQPINGNIHCHTLWTDGSLVQGRGLFGGSAGGAVVWRNRPGAGWKSLKRRVTHPTRDSNLPEVMAVSMAMKKAVELVRTARASRTNALHDEVLIFTDSSFAVTLVGNAWRGVRQTTRTWPDMKPWIDDLLVSYGTLRTMGVRVEVHWVPGHSGVEGNSQAHLAARASIQLP
ncbi:hypothetical protein N7493_008481 [Penicillium malachiteum]|uniref:RNase H type-1 domain-containing protein n=1 Tax=Penicillium malachiteum TaxID=1324776 RepID=A0AAD6HHE4_9EURO|nr:hypothetical protein N7493_008481 [Penicillium malachiteum]